MHKGLNIIHTLTQVKLYGIAPSLDVYRNWDNCKDIQDPPELHVGFRSGITVIKIQTMSDHEDDGVAPTAPLSIASRQSTHLSKMDEKRKATRCGRKITTQSKYSSGEYGKYL